MKTDNTDNKEGGERKISVGGSSPQDLNVTWEDGSFTLNPLEVTSSKNDPMWSGDASTPADWYLYEE